jgi:hypothetical protein
MLFDAEDDVHRLRHFQRRYHHQVGLVLLGALGAARSAEPVRGREAYRSGDVLQLTG